MANALTLPIFAGLAVAGAALGIHLGKSSIAQIDPSFFAEPATRFHADMVPNPPPIEGQYAVRMDGARTIGLGSGCIGCRSYPEEYYPTQDPAVESAYAASAFVEEPAVLPAFEQNQEGEQSTRSADLERIERYASYRVSSDEEAAQAAPAEAEVSAEDEASAIQGDEAAAE